MKDLKNVTFAYRNFEKPYCMMMLDNFWGVVDWSPLFFLQEKCLMYNAP